MDKIFFSEAKTLKKGFTLAEVLITLGIIGVVAAMTLPTLIQKHQEKVRITQLKKAYSTLSQAYNMALNEYGTPDNWGIEETPASVDENGVHTVEDYSGMEKAAEILGKYMNVAKWCEKGKVCDTRQSLGLDGTTVLGNGNSTVSSRSTFYLQDGTKIAMGYIVPLDQYNKYADILVTLPGNRYVRRGENAFYFGLTPKGIKPSGFQGDVDSFSQKCAQRGSNYGKGCTAWVLINENFDYLKCSDLDWGGKTTCK